MAKVSTDSGDWVRRANQADEELSECMSAMGLLQIYRSISSSFPIYFCYTSHVLVVRAKFSTYQMGVFLILFEPMCTDLCEFPPELNGEICKSVLVKGVNTLSLFGYYIHRYIFN